MEIEIDEDDVGDVAEINCTPSEESVHILQVEQNNENRLRRRDELQGQSESIQAHRFGRTLQIQRNQLAEFNSLENFQQLSDSNNRNYINYLPPSSGENLQGYNPIPSTPPPSYTPRKIQNPSELLSCNQIPTPPIELVVVPGNNRYETGDISSSSSEDSENIGYYRFAVRSQRRLKGNHCPDLLNSCSSILPSQQQQIFTRTREETPTGLQLPCTSSDYAEIDEICIQFSHLNTENNIVTVNSTTTERRNIENQGECLANSSNNINYEADYNQAMGQSLSLRRPKLSMTWVLREQQQQQSQQSHSNSTNSNSNETTSSDQYKKKSKHKNKDEKLNNDKYVSSHNLQEYQDKREPCKDLLFVCTPQKHPISHENFRCTEILRRRRQEYRNNNCEKYPSSVTKTFKVSESVFEKLDHESTYTDAKSLKGTYSEPSLIAASEGNQRRHRHRKRRDRNRLQKFGYEIRNVDEFLSKCSLSSPGNIPVVLSSSSTLYQTRPGGYQIEIPLPLGMVVNAVFKNQNWLYVQTPHAEEGYVGYSSCLPLGILPPAARRSSSSTATNTGSVTQSTKPVRCWETNGDIFPKPCGNMTDSEKEIRLRGGTRSEGARTPRLRKTTSSSTTVYKSYGERHVDRLYLRAASQPKLAEKSYAQLKSTNKMRLQQHAESLSRLTSASNDEYVYLHKQQQLQHQQHHRPKIISNQCSNNYQNNCKTRNLLRQTLLAITSDYTTDSISVNKGEIVTLIECRESKDRRQWFYIKTRDGREGYIPAECAGNGFL